MTAQTFQGRLAAARREVHDNTVVLVDPGELPDNRDPHVPHRFEAPIRHGSRLCLTHLPGAAAKSAGSLGPLALCCWRRYHVPFTEPSEFNKQVNQIRYVIDQVIATFKTWRIMHTDYRRPLSTFTTTISAVIAVHFGSAS